MKITFDYDKNDSIISSLAIEDQRKKASHLELELLQKLPKLYDFLKKENEAGNGIEIHVPFFEVNSTVILSILKKKILISILDHKDSKVYGNLLVDGYDCVSIDELKKLKDWNTWERNKLSVFKFRK